MKMGNHIRIVGPGILVVDPVKLLKRPEVQRQMAVWRKYRALVLRGQTDD